MPLNVTGRSGTNVYINTNLSANAPLIVNQTSFENPITLSLKGLNGYGTANQIMKMNSAGTQLEWVNDNNTEYTAGNQLNLSGTQFNLDTDLQVDSLGVGTYFDVDYSNPYTAIFNGNNYSTSNPYLRWHYNGTDLQFNIPANSGSSSNFKWNLQSTTTLMTLDGNGLLTVLGNIKAGSSTDNGQIEIQHSGASGEIGELIFSNGTNVNTYSFEYSENTNNFSFKKNSAVLWDYDDSNSPAKFTVYPIFKFGNTVFHNASNYSITLPTPTQNGEKLALISDITAANYWSLSSNDLKTASTSYNVILGKATPTTGNPKLDVLGNAVIDGDITMTGTLQVEDHYAVNHTDPYTYIYDPTGYSTSNPYLYYHTNGTSMFFNLPVNSGSNSNYRFLTANSAELMRLDAARTLKIFGTTSAKLELSNDDGLSSSSSLHFTNDVDSQKYFMEFKPSQPSDSFNFKYDTGVSETGLLNYNSSTEKLTIGKNVVINTEDSGNTNLFLTCGNTSGNGSIIVFGDSSDEDRFTFGYENTSTGGILFIADSSGTQQISYDSNTNIFSVGNNLLETNGYLGNGNLIYTLPSSTGTIALTSQLGANVFNTSGTTMVADPQANDSNICTQFKISAGPQANGDCTLIIEADTDNTTVETANPIIKLVQDGGNNEGRLELTSDNYLQITNPDSRVIIHSYDDVEIYAGSTPDEGIRVDSTTRNLEVHNNIEILNDPAAYIYFGQSGNSGNLYIMGNSADDFVIKIGTSSAGGDMKLFRNNTPSSSTAGNWEGDIFLTQTAGNLVLYGGYNISGGSGQNLRIGSGAIHGTVAYTPTSDDRLKTEETPITNATDIIMKLKPQTYMKAQFMGTESADTLPAGLDITTNNQKHFEAGLIAQEVYYDVPELRFMIKSEQDMSEIQELPEGVKPEDVHDEEWNQYGWSPDYSSSFSYTELIPYLIKMNQEQQQEINTLKQELSSIKNIIEV